MKKTGPFLVAAAALALYASTAEAQRWVSLADLGPNDIVVSAPAAADGAGETVCRHADTVGSLDADGRVCRTIEEGGDGPVVREHRDAFFVLVAGGAQEVVTLYEETMTLPEVETKLNAAVSKALLGMTTVGACRDMMNAEADSAAFDQVRAELLGVADAMKRYHCGTLQRKGSLNSCAIMSHALLAILRKM